MAEAGEALSDDEPAADVHVLVVDDDVDYAESHGWEASVGGREQGTRIEIRF